MTDEERDLITRFVQRVAGAPQSAGSVPATVPATVPALPPIDPEADRLIGDLLTRYPEARYRLTQTAFVQEHALTEAQNQISQLQYQLQQARQAMQAPAQPAASPWGAAAQPQAAPQQPRGIFGGLFGGGQQAAPAPQYQQPQYAQPQYAQPAPQYAPGYQPGMFQRQGSGFLGSALTTAAGVAGGMVAGNALMNLFEGGHGGGFGGGGFGGGGFGGQPGVEYVPVATDPGLAPDPYDAGGAAKDFDNSGGGGWTDTGSTDNSGGGWTDTSGTDDSGGGWTDSSDNT